MSCKSLNASIRVCCRDFVSFEDKSNVSKTRQVVRERGLSGFSGTFSLNRQQVCIDKNSLKNDITLVVLYLITYFRLVISRSFHKQRRHPSHQPI